MGADAVDDVAVLGIDRAHKLDKSFTAFLLVLEP